MGGLVYAQGLCLIGRAVVIWAEPDTKIEADRVALLWLGELVVGRVLNACSSHRCRNSMAVGPRGRNIMVVFALIGGYYCSWIVRRPLNMFPDRASYIRTFVITPAIQKIIGKKVIKTTNFESLTDYTNQVELGQCPFTFAQIREIQDKSHEF